MNYGKSSIFFSQNTLARDKDLVSSLLGVRPSNDTERFWDYQVYWGKRKN